MTQALPSGVRRARWAVAVVFAVHGAAAGTFATRIPWLQQHLHLSAGALGLALVFPALGASLAMPLAGRFVHRYGCKAATRALILLWCAAMPLPALSPSLPVLCAALLCYGAAAGTSDVVMNAQAVEVERRYGRSVMSGLHGMWSAGGLLASGVGVVAARASLDARIHQGAMAVLLAGAALAASRWLLDVRPEPEQEAPPRFALPPRSALLIGAVGFCAIFAEGAAQDWCGVFLRDVAGASAGVAAGAYTAFSCTMALTRFGGDLVIRRLGPVRAVRLGGAAATAGGALVALSHSAAPAIAGFALLGVGIAVAVPLTFAAAGRSGDDPSRAIAGVATISYAAGLVAPAVIGGVANATSLAVSFALVTALCAALFAGAGTLRPASPHPAPAPSEDPLRATHHDT